MHRVELRLAQSLTYSPQQRQMFLLNFFVVFCCLHVQIIKQVMAVYRPGAVVLQVCAPTYLSARMGYGVGG